jgi:hypothetical protein
MNDEGERRKAEKRKSEKAEDGENRKIGKRGDW